MEGEPTPVVGDQTPVRKQPRAPLVLRMYAQRHMVDVVRLFGYAEIPVDEARRRIRELVEKYGRAAVEAATDEIVFVDDSKQPAVARLSDEARRLVIQILGRPTAAGSDTPAEAAPASSNQSQLRDESGTAEAGAGPSATTTPTPTRKRRQAAAKAEPGNTNTVDRPDSPSQ